MFFSLFFTYCKQIGHPLLFIYLFREAQWEDIFRLETQARAYKLF